MHEWQSLSYVRWESRYHVVLITNCRRKVFGVFQTPAPNGGYLTYAAPSGGLPNTTAFGRG
jgi:hypothetical protein